MKTKAICLAAYSGHAFVVCDIFLSQGQIVTAYTEVKEKIHNPFGLRYLGDENNDNVAELLRNYDYFVCIGENKLRRRITEKLCSKLGPPTTALHRTATIGRHIQSGDGVSFGPRVIVNSKAEIGDGVILNSGCIVEHECVVGNFSHVAPGAILCGNVHVGENTLIGASSVVVPGIRIGTNVIVGAGSVVTRDIPDNVVFAGNPARELAPEKLISTMN